MSGPRLTVLLKRGRIDREQLTGCHLPVLLAHERQFDPFVGALSPLKMTSYKAFHSQLASIMEALTKAAVAEICELVDDSYAVLQLELTRSHKENEALRRKLELIETIIARGHRGAMMMEASGGELMNLAVGTWGGGVKFICFHYTGEKLLSKTLTHS